MTIVIATRGIDLSVGAVMAVSGAVALTIIHGSGEPEQPRHRRCPRSPSGSLVALVLGVVERLPRRGARDPAHHRHARADAGRPRRRPADHRRLHHHGQQRAVQVHRQRLPARSAVRVLHLRRRRSRSSRSSSGGRRSACSPRRSASTPRRAGSPVSGRAGIIFGAYVVSGLLAGIAGIIYSSNIMAADANAAGALHRARTRSSPSCWAARRCWAASSASPAP